MSTVLIVTPIVISNWPLIMAAATAAVSALGYTVATDSILEMNDCRDDVFERDITKRRVREEISLENSEILTEAQNRGETLTIEKDNVKATFHRDIRGTLRLTIEALGYTKEQIRQIGDELIGRVTQQYAYNRIMTEMKLRGMEVVEETVEADDTVKIRVKNFR